jgi:N-terminal half of MaoC dehydratase
VALPLEKLGTTYPPRTTPIDADRARSYAAATNDPNPAYEAGKGAPPVFGVVPTWECLGQAVELVPPEVAMFDVHGEQDMHFHQLLVRGRSITSRCLERRWRRTAPPAAYVFEATSQGAVVVKNGLAEVV